jgi:hypothetical protein
VKRQKQQQKRRHDKACVWSRVERIVSPPSPWDIYGVLSFFYAMWRRALVCGRQWTSFRLWGCVWSSCHILQWFSSFPCLFCRNILSYDMSCSMLFYRGSVRGIALEHKPNSLTMAETNTNESWGTKTLPLRTNRERYFLWRFEHVQKAFRSLDLEV